MRKRLMAIAAAVLVTILAVAIAISFADEYGCKESKGHYGKSKSEVESKAYKILKYGEELRLSDIQIDKIKELLLKSKKDAIKQDAEIEVITLDIKSQMRADNIDTEVINTLIDKKYELKKAKAKSSMAAYIQLKSILTNKQKGRLKKLYKKGKTKKEKSSR